MEGAVGVAITEDMAVAGRVLVLVEVRDAVGDDVWILV